MEQDKKDEVQAVLLLLKNTLIKNGVSIAVNKDTGALMFFDTNIYINTKKFKGFEVEIQDLVR